VKCLNRDINVRHKLLSVLLSMICCVAVFVTQTSSFSSDLLLQLSVAMARELLIEKATSGGSVALTHRNDCAPLKYRRTRSSSSSKSQRQYFVVNTTTPDDMNDDFRTYRKFSADASCQGGGRGEEGIVMSLIRRCRSRSSSRSGRSRRRGSDDDEDDVVEKIELSQLSGCALTRLTDLSDAGHKFVTVYVDTPVWCDKCGQLIIGVYGHFALCQCEYLVVK